jgi:hypothetical protein
MAARHAGSLLILDDGLARQHARLLNLRMTGTAGILLRAKNENRIDAIKPLLERLRDLGFFLDGTTEAAILRLAGEA